MFAGDSVTIAARPRPSFNGVPFRGGFLDFRQQYPELCENNELASPSPATLVPHQLLPHQDVHSATASTSAAINGLANGDDSRASVMTAPYLNRLSLPSSFSQPCIASLASPSAPSEGPTEILDYMFLGSQQDALDVQMLKRNGITKIINLSENCPRPECIAADERHFLRIPIKDSYCAKLQPHFERAFDFIEDARRTNQKVLVHCLAGISRSATLAIAYVMRCKGLASDEAYRFVKAKRPSISPNFNFMGQLLEYEKVLRDEGILKSGSRPRSFNCPTLEALPSATSDMTPNKSAPSSAEKFLIKSASSDVISSSSSHETSLSSMENRKRTIDTPLTFPERPRQLMRNMRPQQSCRMQSVQEDIPSPSTEFSKLDISLTNPCFGLASASQPITSSETDTATAVSRESFSAAPMLENPMFAMFAAAQSSASPSASSSEAVPAKKPVHSCAKKAVDCCKKASSACSSSRTTKTSFFRTVFRKGKTSGGALAHNSHAVHSTSSSAVQSSSSSTSRLRFRRLHARIPVDVLPTLHDSEAPQSSDAATTDASTSQQNINADAHSNGVAGGSAEAGPTYSPVLLGDSPESGFVDDYASSSMDSQTSPTASKSSSVGADALPAYRDPERESISSASSLEIAVQ